MQALVLCAGYGTRLGDETASRPKCMVDIGGKPLLCHTFDWLRRAGIDTIMVNLHHHPEAVMDYFKDGSRFGVRLAYSVEEKLLGTAGAVAQALPWMRGTSVIVYGDMFCRFPLASMIQQHQTMPVLATLACHQSDRPSSDGVVTMTGDRITGIEEKPEHPTSDYVFAGVIVCEPFFRMLTIGQRDLARDVLPLATETLQVAGYDVGVGAMDVGTPDRLAKARSEWQ